MSEQRLIDANALKMAFEEDGHLSAYIEEYINDAPTIDAVPVVRCRECAFRGSDYCPMCHDEYTYDEDDGFCHEGERLSEVNE